MHDGCNQRLVGLALLREDKEMNTIQYEQMWDKNIRMLETYFKVEVLRRPWGILEKVTYRYPASIEIKYLNNLL